MITLVKRPPLISFAGNPARYALQSDNFVSSQGEFASLTIEFTSIDTTPDHSFALNTYNASQVFALKSTDSGSGNEIPAATSGMAVADWIVLFAAALLKNYFLFNNYDISYGADFITITALQKGTDFTIRFVNTNIVGVAEGSHTAGVDIGYRAGFGILLQVHGAGGDLVGEDFRSVDEEGNAVFDISDYLQGLIEDFTPPLFHIVPDIHNSTIHYEGIKRYFVAWCEKYIDTYLAIAQDDIRYAVMGGLSREARVWWNEQDDSFWENAVNLTRFLTWCPRRKNTTTTQIERLFFLACNNDNLSLTPHIEVLFDDDSNSIIDLNTITMVNFSVIELQVGFTDLGLDLLGKTITGWRVWLTNGSGLASEVFEFVLDTHVREHDRQFIFRNSFGWYDTVLLTGKIESDLEYDRQEGYTIIEDEETVYNAPDKSFQNPEQQTFAGSTGWLKKDYLEWLRDMFLSREIYEVIDGRCYPVVITSKKVIRSKDMDDNVQLDIEYRRSYNDEFYAPISLGNSQSPVPLTWDSSIITFDNSLITFDQDQS